MSDTPRADTATFRILTAGYYGRGVASTVGLIRDGAARYHDHWPIYEGDTWTSRDAERFELAPSITLIRTTGHSAEDITTLASTADGVIAFTHVWWDGNGPAEDPYADMEQLHASRARVLAVADVAIPGHGPASDTTPR